MEEEGRREKRRSIGRRKKGGRGGVRPSSLFSQVSLLNTAGLQLHSGCVVVLLHPGKRGLFSSTHENPKGSHVLMYPGYKFQHQQSPNDL